MSQLDIVEARDLMQYLVFAPKWNHKRNDAMGAFQPEAKRFLKHYGEPPGNVILIDNRQWKSRQRADVLTAINSCCSSCVPTVVALFCHGYKGGLQLGFRNRHAAALARSIAAIGDKSVRVVLYACDTGRDLDRDRRDDLKAFGGDGGFADRLRDELCKHGAVDCQVDSHTTAGHATRNPHVRRFEGRGSPIGGVGGYYLVPRKPRAMWRAWRTALRTPFRFSFPLMAVGEIHRRLLRGSTSSV